MKNHSVVANCLAPINRTSANFAINKATPYFALSVLSACLSLSFVSSAENLDSTQKPKTEKLIEKVTVLGDSNTQGANLGGIELKSLPINSFVVGRLELERLAIVDPDEFLDRIPGETQVRNLRVPDGGKSYTIPMLDGIPLENPYEGATQRLDRTNTFDIERVEVIKGPTSALFPNNAFGGIINVVSRDAPKQAETLVSLESGDFNRLRARVSTGGTVDSVGYFFDANTRELDGLRALSKNDRKQASGKLNFELNDYTQLITRAEYLEEVRNERGDLTAQQLAEDPSQAGSLSSSTDLKQSTLSLSLIHLLNSGEIKADLVRREKDTIGASRFRGPQDENDLAYTYKIQYRHDFETSNLITGIERYDGEQNTFQFARNDLELSGTSDFFINSLNIDALYAQFQYPFTQDLTATLGARYEDITQVHTDFSEAAEFSDTALKFGITYSLNPDILLWGNISEGFYVPDLDDLYIDPIVRAALGVNSSLSNLAPEQALNIEFGIRGQVGAWYFDSSAYHNDIDDYLVTQEFFVADSAGQELEYEQTTNAGKVSIKGIESVLEYAPKTLPFRIGVTHTFTRNKYDSFVQSTPGASDDFSGNILRRSPDHHLNVRIAWLPIDKLTIELEGDYYSDYFADRANSDESRFKRDERINLRINYQLEQWRLWLHALNITNTMEDRATFSRGTMRFRTIDGRTLYAGASYSF